MRQIPFMPNGSLAILGAGNMAEAIARAVIASKTLAPAQIIASDPYPARRELFESELKVRVVDRNADAVRDASIVLQICGE